jgi:hypothetical protein
MSLEKHQAQEQDETQKQQEVKENKELNNKLREDFFKLFHKAQKLEMS